MSRLTFRSLSPTRVCMATPQGDRELLAFAGCNYLGLSTDPRVHAALDRALRDFGISASASRQTTGNTTIHEDLEAALASHVGCDAAVLTPEGYTANLAVAEVLAARRPVALIDDRSHRSVTHAMQAAGIECCPFPHGQTEAAAALIGALRSRGDRRPVLLATDGVFAADGSVAPLAGLMALLGSEDILLVDDCHGLGTLGAHGAGTLDHCGIDPAGRTSRSDGPEICVTLTLGKALGCYGGAVLGSRPLVQEVLDRSSLYRATTPTPPPLAAAALESLRICREEPAHLSRLGRNSALLRATLRQADLACPDGPAPVVAFTLSSERSMEQLHDGLLGHGILAPLIDYPGGPAPRYFRLSVSALHSEADIQALGGALSVLRGGPPSLAARA